MEPRVLRTLDDPVHADGESYTVNVCGRLRPDGQWEAWIEFVPVAGGPALRSRRETTQSDLPNLARWAAGLTDVYVEGSLQRTLRMEAPRPPVLPPLRNPPHFAGPSPESAARGRVAPDDTALNPVVQFRHGEAHLRQKLADLPAADLRTIALVYDIDQAGSIDVDSLGRDELIELIVAWVKRRD